MSCAEVRMCETLKESFEETFERDIPNGMCLCVLENGRIGMLGKINVMDKIDLNIRERIYGIDTDEDSNARNLCTGNLLRG